MSLVARIARALGSGKLTLFTGAGFSNEATDHRRVRLPTARLFNMLDDSILPELRDNGGDVAAISSRWTTYATIARDQGADVILNACSSIGELCETVSHEVGVRIVLLMAAYARGGAGLGPTAGQRRFCDRSVEAYLARVERLAAQVAGDPLVTVGYAPHSLRAVPREWLVEIARHAAGTGYPLHIHAGEQPREVAESLDEFGLRPIDHLQDCGVLGPGATVVHATAKGDRRMMHLRRVDAARCFSIDAS